MSTRIENNLTQLSETFTVSDIMTKTADLLRGRDFVDAESYFKDNREFDIIPLPAEGSISSYLRRGGTKTVQISRKYLISDSTTLTDLPHLFKDQEFYFVLTAKTPFY